MTAPRTLLLLAVLASLALAGCTAPEEEAVGDDATNGPTTDDTAQPDQGDEPSTTTPEPTPGDGQDAGQEQSADRLEATVRFVNEMDEPTHARWSILNGIMTTEDRGCVFDAQVGAQSDREWTCAWEPYPEKTEVEGAFGHYPDEDSTDSRGSLAMFLTLEGQPHLVFTFTAKADGTEELTVTDADGNPADVTTF